MATLQPPVDTTGFRATLEDHLAALLGAGFRSRTSRLEKKREAWEVQQQGQQQNGGRRQWRGTFLHLSEVKGALQASVRFSIVKRPDQNLVLGRRPYRGKNLPQSSPSCPLMAFPIPITYPTYERSYPE